MPDYASILRRSISALPDSSSEMREAVYQRARAALARQLTAVDPPLSTREIQAQHQDLEDAVARLEADYAPSDDGPLGAEEAGPPQMEYFSPPPPPAPTLRTPTPVNPAGAAAYDAEETDDVDEDGDEDDFEEERASRTPLLVGLLLLILVIGGAAVYAYAERDRILALLDFSGPAAVAVAERPAEAGPGAAPVAPESDKRPDRLTNGPDAPPAEQASLDPALAEPEPEPNLPADAQQPVAPLPSESNPGLDAEQQTAALGQPGESLVEQRAIYYYQGAEGTPGQASNGTVTWAQTTRDNGPAVQAVLRLAEQEVTTTVTIYKNADSSLPASHLVEVQFSGQIGPTPVQRVPALVIKQTEQARGQPLTGAAVPVTNELFWIALSDDAEQVTRNLQLLREGSWFDIPILFNDGTRALLTFEKGIPGDKAFETAMAAWLPS